MRNNKALSNLYVIKYVLNKTQNLCLIAHYICKLSYFLFYYLIRFKIDFDYALANSNSCLVIWIMRINRGQMIELIKIWKPFPYTAETTLYVPTDDQFLLMFLRPCKFYPQSAMDKVIILVRLLIKIVI